MSRFELMSTYSVVGPLLKHIEKKKVFTEKEASLVVKDIVSALDFLHKKGMNVTANHSEWLNQCRAQNSSINMWVDPRVILLA